MYIAANVCFNMFLFSNCSIKSNCETGFINESPFKPLFNACLLATNLHILSGWWLSILGRLQTETRLVPIVKSAAFRMCYSDNEAPVKAALRGSTCLHYTPLLEEKHKIIVHCSQIAAASGNKILLSVLFMNCCFLNNNVCFLF